MLFLLSNIILHLINVHYSQVDQVTFFPFWNSCCSFYHLLFTHVVSWLWNIYCKFPKYSDTHTICCNHSKIWTMWLYHTFISPNNADGMAKSVDPDQTAVWSGSALFAQAYLSENLGSLQKILLTGHSNSDQRNNFKRLYLEKKMVMARHVKLLEKSQWHSMRVVFGERALHVCGVLQAWRFTEGFVFSPFKG